MLNYPEDWKSLNAALCHDWLTGMRGGERCLELLCDGFPKAPIYTLLHKQGSVSDRISSHPVVSSYVDRIPGLKSRYRYALPLFPSAIDRLGPPNADLIVSTSHCVAKSLRSRPDARHVCYCFTPMRYAWTFYDEYFGSNPLKAAVAKPMLRWLRAWDKKTSDRVDRFVAISKHVQKRIQEFYGRESDIVYPPVDTERVTPAADAAAPAKSGFDLVVSALVPYKRVDLAVQAYRDMGFPLMVVGTGTEMNRLRAIAGHQTTFLGWLPDEKVLDLYQRCRALIFPGEEDFGIVPLEAQACGRPVVAYAKGGALETVKDGETGVFFKEQTPEALIEAVNRCGRTDWDPPVIRKHAETFGNQVFIDGLAEVIRKVLAQPARS